MIDCQHKSETFKSYLRRLKLISYYHCAILDRKRIMSRPKRGDYLNDISIFNCVLQLQDVVKFKDSKWSRRMAFKNYETWKPQEAKRNASSFGRLIRIRFCRAMMVCTSAIAEFRPALYFHSKVVVTFSSRCREPIWVESGHFFRTQVVARSCLGVF
jgi:hypothetical protein